MFEGFTDWPIMTFPLEMWGLVLSNPGFIHAFYKTIVILPEPGLFA